jgi:type IV secretion system protein VirD4
VGIIAQAGDAFGRLCTPDSREYASISSVAIRNTQFLDSPPIRAVLQRSDFSLSELKTRPEGMSLYLTLPQRQMGTHFRWLRMITTLTITEIERVRGKPKHPVLMCLDEFAGLQRMEVIENAVSQIAGFGEQPKASYPCRRPPPRIWRRPSRHLRSIPSTASPPLGSPVFREPTRV